MQKPKKLIFYIVIGLLLCITVLLYIEYNSNKIDTFTGNNLVNYDKVNSLFIGDKLIMYDIFCRNNELILICPVSVEDTFDKIQIKYNNKIIPLHKRTNSTDGCAVAHLLYNLNIDKETEIDIEMQYVNKTYTYKLHHIFQKQKKYKFTASTLMKDDYFLINKYVNYYKKQGVEHFYLYYNGNIENMRKYNVIDENMTTLIEWNFPYPDAQVGEMNQALYKYGILDTQYMFFNDLDEYAYSPNKKLVDLLASKKDTYVFSNVWCDDIEIPRDMNEYYRELEQNLNLPAIFYKDKFRFSYPIRSKCIHNTESIYAVEGHQANEYYDKNPEVFNEPENVILHFFRWTPPHMHHAVRTREDMDFINFDKFSV